MSLLNPLSIAVVGASTQPGKVGHDVFVNIAKQGYKGPVYPVNAKPGEIEGHQTIPSLAAIGKPVDLAIIVTPAPTVAGILKECAELKILNVVVISAGFGEVHTEESKEMETELKAIARNAGIRLVGPNCLGILRPGIGLNASFAKELPPAGGIALISQSGATAVGLMDGASSFGLGFSSVLSIGNKTVLDECDYVRMCADDPQTRVIGLYLESIRDGRAFLKICREVTTGNVAFHGRGKPIVLLKSGVSAQGGKAASSHTGALAGSDAGVKALCIQTGIRRAHSTEEFLDLLSVLSTQPMLRSPNIALITNAGGPGILATDAAEAAGLTLPALDERTLSVLKPALPSAASTNNPIDVLGDAGVDRYAAALKACAEDPNIDGIVALLTPQVMTPCEDIAMAIIDIKRKSPMIPIVTSFLGASSVEGARVILRHSDIPTFDTPERAVQAMAGLMGQGTWDMGQQKEQRATGSSEKVVTCPLSHVTSKGLLPEEETRQLFALYDLPMPKQGVAATEDEAVALFKEIDGAVIAKISSPDILHKTDVGGIKGNLKSEKDVRAAFTEIMKNVTALAPRAKLRGVLIQQYLPAGDEFIVGAVQDPAFGTLIMVGLGGIYTELFRDTSFRVAPLSEEDTYDMLKHLKSWKILLGARGKPQSDIPALAQLILNVNRMIADCPQIKELDLNPVLVNDKGVVVADAKVVC